MVGLPVPLCELIDREIHNLSDLRRLNIKLNSKLNQVKNNNDYKYYSNLISIVDELIKNHSDKDDYINTKIKMAIRDYIGKSFYDFCIYIFNQNKISDKDFSLFMKKLGYDGFSYKDYEYIIFNPEKLNVIAHIKKENGKLIEI